MKGFAGKLLKIDLSTNEIVDEVLLLKMKKSLLVQTADKFQAIFRILEMVCRRRQQVRAVKNLFRQNRDKTLLHLQGNDDRVFSLKIFLPVQRR